MVFIFTGSIGENQKRSSPYISRQGSYTARGPPSPLSAVPVYGSPVQDTSSSAKPHSATAPIASSMYPMRPQSDPVSNSAPMDISNPFGQFSTKQPTPQPANVLPHRRNIVVSTEPSDDIYGGDVLVSGVDNTGILDSRRSRGPFDLDSYEEELRSNQSVSFLRGPRPPPPTQQPIRVSSPSSSQHPALSPYSRTLQYADDSGAGESVRQESLKICPVCNATQPVGTTVDEFQTHVLSCLGQQDAAPTPETSQQQQSSQQHRINSDMICPVCQMFFPPNSSMQEFEAHVNNHFADNEFAIVDSSVDNFTTPP